MKLFQRTLTHKLPSFGFILLYTLLCEIVNGSNIYQSSSMIPPIATFVPSVPPLLYPSVTPTIKATSAMIDVIATPNCSAVTHIFENRGIHLAEIPQKPNNVTLRYCQSPSCCTFNMETTLAMSSRTQLEKYSRESINKLSTLLNTRSVKFNDVFGQLLVEAKQEFHDMFKRTYGVIYEQNSYVFADLFNELEKYFARGNVDLAIAMESFFNTLYQKMFTVLNAQYTFDEKYLSCVSEHMNELKPFSDVPDKLSAQIKRSFVATRTYSQALLTASEVVKKMTSIRLNADCTAALTKMQTCGTCSGHEEKPCLNYCVNVMKGCLHYFNELDIEWDNFVIAMDKLSERLLGSFNIVMVVVPINIKISEAIMVFQEAGQDISNRVFSGCGRPSLPRGKRAINPKFMDLKNLNRISDDDIVAEDILDIDVNFDNELKHRNDRIVKRAAEPEPKDYDRNNQNQYSSSSEERNSRGGNGGGNNNNNNNNNNRKRKKQQNKKNDDDDEYPRGEPVLDRLIKDIRQKVKDSKKFWSNLPHLICNNENVTADSDSHCWNGNSIDRYTHSVTLDHGTNPEFNGNPATIRQTSTVASQLHYLKIATNHLRNAYNGLDVQWPDPDDTFDGSGDGSGNGRGIDDEDGDDDDEGSGLGGLPHVNKPIVPEDTNPSVRVNSIDDDTDGDDDDDDEETTSINHNTSSGPKYTDGDNNYDEQDNLDGKPKGGSSRLKEMSLRRALVLYLFPIYMAWFGGIVTDLL